MEILSCEPPPQIDSTPLKKFSPSFGTLLAWEMPHLETGGSSFQNDLEATHAPPLRMDFI
jgi:hypothetical protein